MSPAVAAVITPCEAFSQVVLLAKTFYVKPSGDLRSLRATLRLVARTRVEGLLPCLAIRPMA
jgi:hypothetical protein